MKQVKCKSGLTGWQCKIQKNYTSLEELKEYDSDYNIAKRLGYDSIYELWEENPTIQGSTNPSDLRVVKLKKN